MASEVTVAREGGSKASNAQGRIRRASTMESFLEGYRPKNRSFTSNLEIAEVTHALKLSDKTLHELVDTRNKVVKYYSDRMSGGDRSYMTPMQSVTAVIDHVMVQKYRTV